MQPAGDRVSQAVIQAACDELDGAVAKIRHCLDQLSDDQIWWRPDDEMNSIGNLMLHVCGNLRQWLVSGVGGAADVRDRPSEFAERGPIAKQKLLTRLEEVVAEAQAALAAAPSEGLLEMRRVQQFDVTGFGAMFHSICHLWGHVQEIIHMTRVQLGAHYRFHFEPAKPKS